MIQRRDVEGCLKEIIEDVERNHPFQNNGLLRMEKMIFFCLFEEKSSENNEPSQYAQDIITALNYLKKNMISNGAVECVYCPCNAPKEIMMQDIKKLMKQAADLHSVTYLNQFLICPIILGGEFSTEAAFERVYEEWISFQMYVFQNGLNASWQPFLLLKNDTAMSFRQLAEGMMRCVLGLRKYGFDNHILLGNHPCIVSDRDERMNSVPLEEQIRTMLMTAVIYNLSSNNIAAANVTSYDDLNCFTTRGITITEPIRYFILSKIRQYTNDYYCKAGEQDNEEIVPHLATELGMFPQKVMWRESIKKLPWVNDAVSLEPVWSLMLTSDADVEGNRMTSFSEEYYLRHLDIKTDKETFESFENLLLDAYFLHNNGTCAGLLKLLYHDEKNLENLRSTASQQKLKIRSSGFSESEGHFHYRAEKMLENEINKRTETAISYFLDPSKEFIVRIKNKLNEIDQDFREIDHFLEEICRQYTYSEVNLGGGSYSKIQSNIRSQFIENFIDILKNAKGKSCISFIKFIYENFHGEIQDRSTYMKHLSEYVGQLNDTQLGDLKRTLDEKLMFPLRLNSVHAQETKYVILGDSQNFAAIRFANMYSARGYQLGANEQIEILRISQPVEFTTIVGFGM